MEQLQRKLREQEVSLDELTKAVGYLRRYYMCGSRFTDYYSSGFVQVVRWELLRIMEFINDEIRTLKSNVPVTRAQIEAATPAQ